MSVVSKDTYRKVKVVSSPIIKAMLRASYFAGLAGVIIVAPNALAAWNLFIDKSGKPKNKSRFNYYAKSSGYFEVQEIDKNKYAITLTNKGKQSTISLLYEEFELPVGTDWDGEWHILMFDIKEQHKSLRDAIATKVRSLGMLPLQNSVYVYPFDISEFCQNLHTVYPTATSATIHLVAKSIEGESQLIKKFKQNGVIPT